MSPSESTPAEKPYSDLFCFGGGGGAALGRAGKGRRGGGFFLALIFSQGMVGVTVHSEIVMQRRNKSFGCEWWWHEKWKIREVKAGGTQKLRVMVVMVWKR